MDAPPTLVTQFVPYVGFLILGYALGQVVLRGKALLGVAVAWLALSAELVLQAALVGDPTSHVGTPKGLGALLGAVSPLTYQGAVLGLTAVALFVLVRSLAHPSSVLAAPAVARRMRSLGDLTFGVFACHLLVFAVVARLPGVDLVKGAESVPGVLGISGTVVVLAFVVTAVLRRIPGCAASSEPATAVEVDQPGGASSAHQPLPLAWVHVSSRDAPQLPVHP